MSGFSVFSRNVVTKGNGRPNGYWGLARDSDTGTPLAPNDQPLFTNFQPTPTQWDPASNTAIEPLPFDKHEDPKLKTKKYAFGTNPIQEEDKLKSFVPPPNLAAKLKDRAYQNMIDEAYRKYQRQPERLGPELLAIITARRQNLDRNLTREVSAEVVDNFRQWLIKKGDVRDHVRAGWWPAKKVGRGWVPDPTPPKFIQSGGALSDDPSVTAYIDSFVLKRVEYEQDLLTMKLEASHGKMQTWNIDQLWKYYKYVVLGLIPDAEYDNLLNTINPGPPAPYVPPGAPPPPPGAVPAPDDAGDREGGPDSFAKYAGQTMPPEMVQAFATLEANAEQYLLTQNQLMEWMARDAEARQKEVQRQRQDKADRYAAKMAAKDIRHQSTQSAADRRHAEQMRILQSGGDAEQADAGKKAQHEALAAAADKRLREVQEQHEKEKTSWAADWHRWNNALVQARGEADAAKAEAARHKAGAEYAAREAEAAKAEAARQKARVDEAAYELGNAIGATGAKVAEVQGELEAEKRLKADMVVAMINVRNQLHAEAEAARQEAIKARTEARELIEQERAKFRHEAEQQAQQQMVLYQQKFADMQAREEAHHRQANEVIADHAKAHEEERQKLLAEVEAARAGAEQQRLAIMGAASEQLAAAGQENEQAKGVVGQLQQLVVVHQQAGAALQQQNAALQEELRQLQLQHANVAKSGEIAQIAWRTENTQLKDTVEKARAYVAHLEGLLAESKREPTGPALMDRPRAASPPLLPPRPSAADAAVPTAPAPAPAPAPRKRQAEDAEESAPKLAPGFHRPAANAREREFVMHEAESEVPVDELEMQEDLGEAVAAWIENPSQETANAAQTLVIQEARQTGADPHKILGGHIAAHFASESMEEDDLAQDNETGRAARASLHTKMVAFAQAQGLSPMSVLTRDEIRKWAQDEYGEAVSATVRRPSELATKTITQEDISMVEAFLRAQSIDPTRIAGNQSLFNLALNAAKGNPTALRHLRKALLK